MASILKSALAGLGKETDEMPLYMDRHDGENLTPEAVAEGHTADLKIQDKYDCKFIPTNSAYQVIVANICFK